MFNKRRFNKVNDKKILHKVKKQWVTISLSLLMMIGGGAVATHVSANADTNVNAKPQITSNAPQSNSTSNITNQAKALHNNMLRNANLTQAKPASLGATNTQAPKVVKTAKWNNANVNYYNNDVMELTGNGSINASDVPNLPVNSNNSDWNLKVDKSNAHIVLNNSKNGGQFSANFHPIWNHFKSMNLSGLDTSNVTNMSNMFENDSHLQSLDLSSFNTNNVTSMDYMFHDDNSLQNVNMSNFNTTNTSMKHMFSGADELNEITLGTNTKLNANHDLRFDSMAQSSDSPNGIYSDPTEDFSNYYPVNVNTPLLNSSTLLLNDNGNDVTTSLRDNTLSAGTYYIAQPVTIEFISQGNNVQDTKAGFFAPVTVGDKRLGYFKPLQFPKYDVVVPKLAQKALANINTFDHDYTINQGINYLPGWDEVGDINGLQDPVVYVHINLNNRKYIQDANNDVQADKNQVDAYKNKLTSDKPYMTASDYTNAINNYGFQELNNDASDTQHALTEPANWNIVQGASGAESVANYQLSHISNAYSRINSNASYTKSVDDRLIAFDKKDTSNLASLASDLYYNPTFQFVKSNSSAMATWNSDMYLIKSNMNEASGLHGDTRADASVANSDNNMANAAYDEMNQTIHQVQHPKRPSSEASNSGKIPAKRGSMSSGILAKYESFIDNTKGSINNEYAYAKTVASNANVKADPNVRITMEKDLLNLSTANEDANYDASHKDEFEAYINATYAANHANEYNYAPNILKEANEYAKEHASSASTPNSSSTASQSVTPASSQASSSASQSIKPSSQASTNSSKASSSVVPSSTSSKASTTSSKASNSSAQSSSAKSQSSQSTASQSNNSSSNVAPSSEQQSSNNNNPTPFVPSFNIPSVPSTPTVPTDNTTSVTPASTENTTPMNNSNNSTNSSVASSVEPENMNNGNNANVTAPTVTSHKNHKNVVRHAKRVSLYLFNSDFKGLSKRNHSVITIKGVEAYRRTRKGHYVAVRGIKRGTKLAVKRVIKFGKITKLQLINGLIVTSNKHFVAIQKPAKRVNKHITKRNRISRYTRALRKSNYVLRHGRRHATRHTYRIAKNFNEANNAEKKAYRKFARKHTNRNRKAYRKAQVNVNNLVNALLK